MGKVIKSKHFKIWEPLDFTEFLKIMVWVQVPLPAFKTIDFTGFVKISYQKVIKKVIKCILEGIPIESYNEMKEGILYI